MKLKSISHIEVLPDDSEVIVKMKHGKVVSSKIVDAHPSGKIVVHKINFYKKQVGRSGRKKIYMKINKTEEVNYSFIQVAV